MIVPEPNLSQKPLKSADHYHKRELRPTQATFDAHALNLKSALALLNPEKHCLIPM
jgi:hypothetical protein